MKIELNFQTAAEKHHKLLTNKNTKLTIFFGKVRLTLSNTVVNILSSADNLSSYVSYRNSVI